MNFNNIERYVAIFAVLICLVILSSCSQDKLSVNVTYNKELGSVIGAGEYLKGEEVSLEASGIPGYDFNGWYVNDKKISDNNKYKLVVTQDINLKVKFEKSSIQHTVDVKISESDDLANIIVKDAIMQRSKNIF